MASRAGAESSPDSPGTTTLPNPPVQPTNGSAVSTTVPNSDIPPSSTVLVSPSTTLGPVFTGADASDHKKPYVITAALRVGYDDNIFTSSSNKVASFTTSTSPSFILDLPTENGTFSARYTFNATYYENRPGSKIDTTHQFLARYSHSFNERFSIDVREQFLYYYEPSLFSGTGSMYRQGAYIDNTGTIVFNAQWTPLVGSTSSFSNNLLQYQDSGLAQEQNSIENTGSQEISFAILPKINLLFAGIIDDISYSGVTRGYTSYTGTTGVGWQALPSLLISTRVGGTVTETDTSNSASVTPYVSLDVNWRLGQRSVLTFSYNHSISPTDVVYASGQVSDRLLATLAYDITTRITVHAQAIFTHSDYTNSLLVPNTLTSFSENSGALAIGGAYHLDNHFDLDAGYTFSDVSSELSFRDYTRNQFYMGIRGIY